MKFLILNKTNEMVIGPMKKVVVCEDNARKPCKTKGCPTFKARVPFGPNE